MKKVRSEKKGEPSGTLPMELRVGDRLGEWEVIGLPYTTADGRIVHARAQRIDQPASWEIRNWDALKRINVQRDSSRDSSATSSLA